MTSKSECTRTLLEKTHELSRTELLPGVGPYESSVASARLRIGTVVDGKYRIDGVLGTGGMGAVYRATHLQLERPVALKAILGELLPRPEVVERFRHEAVAVARLQHPNIVTVHDYGVASDVGAYLVMELLEGGSLREELALRSRIDPPTAVALMGRVCAAVGAAHRSGVIHRDVKPENIFLERRGGAVTVKVVDFGLARLDEAVAPAGRGGSFGGELFGTPAYMSPEQCCGDPADARSDVYAMGCVLYEMLTGERPFAGNTGWAVLFRHMKEAPRRPSEIVEGLAPEVDDAVLRALEKDPAERHQTAEAFAAALGVAEPREATTRRSSPGPSACRPGRGASTTSRARSRASSGGSGRSARSGAG